MKKFFSFIIRQSVAIILIVALVLGLGVYSTLKTPINLLPDINVPMVCVQVIYPGANAQSVEKDVTVELEEGLSSITGVTDVSSYSYDNVSAVILSFNYGTDTNGKKADISAKLSGLKLPDGVTSSVYDIDLNAEALAKFSVTGDATKPDEGLSEAYDGAQALAEKLKAIDGVESVEIKGGPQRNYTVMPFGGLELITPLIVQAFSYGQLDIPLGNVTYNGATVQIRNNTDVTEEDDISETPLTLPSAIVALLSSVKRISSYYQDSTAEELQTLETDMGNGVIQVLHDIDGLTSTQMGDFAKLKTYMNIASSYTARQLKDFKGSRYYNELYKAVTNEPEDDDGERTPKTDEEVENLVDDLKAQLPAFEQYITADMLKVVRDGKIDDLIDFREFVESDPAYPTDNSYYELTDDDYYQLETQYVQVYMPADKIGYNPYDVTGEEQAKLYANIDFAHKTSATGLSQIGTKKRDAEEQAEQEGGEATYSPTNTECALLFTGTTLSEEHPIVSSPTFMAFVRSQNYEYNMRLLIERREEFGYEEDLTAAQLMGLYRELKLEGIFEFKLSEELFSFILEKDASELAGDSLVVSIGEIANIDRRDSYDSYVYYFNGGPGLIKGTIIEIYKSNGANSSAVVQAAKGVCESYSSKGSSTVEVALLDDQSQFISDSISNVLVSMLIGGVLAVLVIFLFLKDWRTSLIIAVTMPLSVLAALICLNLMGITLNMVSLGGLAVGIGMLVDNSIVVIESITKHRDTGKTAFEAAVDGTCEVGGALIGSTLTTVCVFIPILFSGGLTGEIFTDLSWAVIFSLTFSLLVAVTVIPALYALFGSRKKRLIRVAQPPSQGNIPAQTEVAPEEQTAEQADRKPQEDEEQPQTKQDKKRKKSALEEFKRPRIMNGIISFYGKLLPKVLNKKLVTVLIALGVFGGSVGMLFITGTEFLPSIDKGQIEINMTYASGVELGDVQSSVSEFANRLESNVENIDYVSVSVGKNGILALSDTGIITLQLKTNRHTDRVVERVRDMAEAYRKESAICRSATVREIDGVVASLMTGANDMSVTVMGSDPDELRDIAADVKEALEEEGFRDVTTSATQTATQYTLRFDRRKMAELGMDYQTTVLTLRIGIASYSACTVTIDERQYLINVQFEDGAIASKRDLEQFVVGADADDGARAVKLWEILIPDEEGNRVTVEEKEACVNRVNGSRTVTISAVLPGVDTGTAGKKLQAVAKEVLEEYEGYTFQESGITSYLNDAFSGLVVALVISFVLLYGVMAVQFGSWLTPLIVMSSIPFSFTGGFLALVITGTRLNVVSFIGLIMLMGVVVNNAIVMLEKIKQLHGEGAPRYEAVQQACKVRLRPIFMTTLTTILALIPLAVGVGKGSELMQPLGIVVMGGLLLGTLVTLVIVPTVYCAVYGVSAKRPDGRKKRAKAEVQSKEQEE